MPENTAPKLEDFDYELPAELIAQHPARERADSRMLVVRRENGALEDAQFRRIGEFLQPGDVLVLNNSRVLPARLFGYRRGVAAQPVGKQNPERPKYLRSEIEVLLVRQVDERTWEALVKPGRKVRNGEVLYFPGSNAAPGQAQNLEAEVIGRGEYGVRILRFPEGVPLADRLERIGHVPLPPYINRPDEAEDRERYQTVYARTPGSVAAPTAGLHFSEEILRGMESRGIERVEITLHVGLGTFQPIHVHEIAKHQMHAESFEVSGEAAERLNKALAEKRRIIAVGTTTVRTLEHLAAQHGGRILPGTGETRLFIVPGFEFRVIGGLLTNFHLPRTTLLMLISAFAGRELVLEAYHHAVAQRYRFYSYGDCMLIL